MAAPKLERGREAPQWETSTWLNSDEALSLESLRGRVIVVEVFQLLCPGCVSHGLPQAQRIAETFPSADVQVLGLHSVFEHHDAMGPTVLEAFLHEYRISFPVAIDAPSPDGGTPRTMSAYGLRCTPTLLIYDREGSLRHHHFGQVADMAVGAQIAALLAEPKSESPSPGCTDGVCEI